MVTEQEFNNLLIESVKSGVVFCYQDNNDELIFFHRNNLDSVPDDVTPISFIELVNLLILKE